MSKKIEKHSQPKAVTDAAIGVDLRVRRGLPDGVEKAIEMIYSVADDPQYAELVNRYHNRHNITSLLILKRFEGRDISVISYLLADRLKNKTVVEIGAGVGLLSFELAKYAKKVYAVEADPAWNWVFVKFLYKEKPLNLTWIFGAAEQISDLIKADIAIISSNSGLDEMKTVAKKMAKETIII